MIMDSQLLFSDEQAVTAAADSTNVVDLGVARDIGISDLWLFLLVTETMDDTGDDSTLAVTLVTDDNAALSSDSVVMSLVTIPALTAAGTIYFWRIPTEILVAYERYLALAYTPGNGNLSAGKFTAGIVKDIQHWTAFASGFSVS